MLKRHLAQTRTIAQINVNMGFICKQLDFLTFATAYLQLHVIKLFPGLLLNAIFLWTWEQEIYSAHDHYLTTVQIRVVSLPAFTTEAQRCNALNTWSGIKEQNALALWSHTRCIRRQTMGILKILCGWKTYGLGSCYATLNPHHLPGGPGV